MAQLPRIACFHGGGSNGKVFQVQCQQLQAILQNEFEFVYFDAPFPRDAGPGVLPAFEDFKPFATWFKMEQNGGELSDGSGYDPTGRDGVERVLKLMGAVDGAGDWVAAIGFSQGTRIVGGLLLDQQLCAEAGSPRDISLKFGVLCMGGGAPMLSEISRQAKNNVENIGEPVVVANPNVHSITIPTLHLHGLRDSNLENGRKQLATYYDPSTSRLYEIDYHHAMPWIRSEVLEFVSLIRQLYKDTETEN